MGLFDRLFGRAGGRGQSPFGGQQYGQQYGGQQYGRGVQDRPGNADEQAVRRYQYLLQTAPPEKIEQAHAEAFAQMTPQQRQMVLQQLAAANTDERPTDDSPQGLARYATRMEMRRPGTLTRTLGSPMGGGMGMGGMLLTSMAGAFIGTSIASEMFDNDGFMDWDTSGGADGEAAMADGGYDGSEGGGYENVGDSGGGSDFGGGDFGGDFGGGDFGGF